MPFSNGHVAFPLKWGFQCSLVARLCILRTAAASQCPQALKQGCAGPGRATCCLSTLQFLNRSSGARTISSWVPLRQVSSKLGFLHQPLLSLLSLGRELPSADLRGVQICLSYQLLKRACFYPSQQTLFSRMY